MTAEQFWQKLASLNTWRRREKRAPHKKPLLLLLALGYLRHEKPRLILYRDIETSLKQLLKRFGPPHRRYHPEHPFDYLRNDGLWEIEGLKAEHTAASGGLRPRLLRNDDVKGGLLEAAWHLLRDDATLFKQVVEHLLHTYFPLSYHSELLEAVCLREYWESQEHLLRSRDPRFRPEVIQAYEYRCAICGYDIRIDDQLIGLEAAHIRWHANGGPDEVPNGLALCVLHHKAFDRGGISLSDDYRLLVSPALHGQGSAWQNWFSNLESQSMRRPRYSKNDPNLEYLAWHRRHVFRDA